MVDVARRAGVSHQTVSRVLNSAPFVKAETRERVLDAIADLGYRRNAAARALVTDRSRRIGLVCEDLTLHGPSAIASAVQAACHRAGYESCLSILSEPTADGMHTAVERLLDQAVEAVLVAVAHRAALDPARPLELSVPVVLTQGVGEATTRATGIDQVAGAILATEHLLDLGHHRVAHVSGPLDWVEAAQRRRGWLLAHRRRGLEPGVELEGDWTPAAGYRAGRQIARARDVTAVFVANDAMALGVLNALHDAGRAVPAEASVVGFDDVPEAGYLCPPLTTVRQDLAALGEQAVKAALHALAGGPPTSATLLEPALVVRSSTAPPVARASSAGSRRSAREQERRGHGGG